MKKNFYVMLLAMFAGLVANGETYTSRLNGYLNISDMWVRASDLNTITIGYSSMPNNTYNITTNVNFGNWGGNCDGSTFVVKSGGTLTLQSTDNVNITVEPGGTLVVNGDLTEQNTATHFISNAGTVSITGSLGVATITNSGALSIGSLGKVLNATLAFTNTGTTTITTAQDYSGDKRNIVNSGILNFNSSLKQNNSNNNITNTGKINITSTFTYNDGAFNNNLGGEVSIGTNFDISTNNTLKNYGTIIANGALTYNYGGAIYNYSGANILIKGTGSLLNSNSYLYNSGSITFNQNLDIRNAIVKNYIPGSDVEVITNPQGYIAAKSGITLQNSGCIKGGKVDYWGTISGGNGTCTFSNVDLPIELLSLRGNVENSGVVIVWISVSETNNDFFQLEVSTDGRNFSLLGTIDGAGNSTTELQYEFLHKQPSIGVNYYRLSQTDFDGRKRYYAPIAVHYSNMEALIYPTVIHGDDIVNVHLSSVTVDVPFQIISQDGKIIETGTVSNDSELPSDLFQYGLNQLIIGSDNSITTTSIVKQ